MAQILKPYQVKKISFTGVRNSDRLAQTIANSQFLTEDAATLGVSDENRSLPHVSAEVTFWIWRLKERATVAHMNSLNYFNLKLLLEDDRPIQGDIIIPMFMSGSMIFGSGSQGRSYDKVWVANKTLLNVYGTHIDTSSASGAADVWLDCKAQVDIT